MRGGTRLKTIQLPGIAGVFTNFYGPSKRVLRQTWPDGTEINDLANRLRALPPEKDCEALNQKISDLGKRIISEYKHLDQAYDRATDHGVTQGAKLF